MILSWSWNSILLCADQHGQKIFVWNNIRFECWIQSFCLLNEWIFLVSLFAIDCHCDSVTITIRQWSQLLHMKWTIVRHSKYVGWVLRTHIGAKEGGYLNYVVNRDIIPLYGFIHTGWKLLHMYRKYTVNFKILFQTFSD